MCRYCEMLKTEDNNLFSKREFQANCYERCRAQSLESWKEVTALRKKCQVPPQARHRGRKTQGAEAVSLAGALDACR